jgi:hypothetical protein
MIEFARSSSGPGSQRGTRGGTAELPDDAGRKVQPVGGKCGLHIGKRARRVLVLGRTAVVVVRRRFGECHNRYS